MLGVDADTDFMMSLGMWLAIGTGALLMVSVGGGLMIAAILGTISRDVSELLETESWSLMPLARRTVAARESGHLPRQASSQAVG